MPWHASTNWCGAPIKLWYCRGKCFRIYCLAHCLLHLSLAANQRRCASAFPFTLARPVSRSAMLAGNCIAWSMASSRTARCPVTRRSAGATTLSTPSSARRAPENMFRVQSTSTWSPPWWTKCARAPTGSCSTQSS
uniref:Putative alpha tubulin ixodes scapularis alpha tubulin n=1 Tax=Amblyomma triste TaxID=251400 RepID=A0A023G2F7_AMBTT